MSGNGKAVQQTPQHQISNSEDDVRRWDDTSALAALHQAIQNSPARILGAQTSPIEVGDELTPKPTRRILFPSPRKVGEFKSLDGLSGQKSSTSSPSTKASTSPQPTRAQQDQEVEQVDKENLPPSDENEANNEFDHLFHESIMPVTPGKITPNTARSIANILKTPTPLKPRTPRTGSKRSAHDHPETPSRSRVCRAESPSANGSGTHTATPKPMTPFTASLSQFLSDGMLTSSPSKAFHWGLRSSPNTKTGGFNFGAPSHDVFSAGYPSLPSSPPLLNEEFEAGFSGHLGFELFEDGTATEGLPGDWGSDFFGGDIGLGGSELSRQNDAKDDEDRRSSCSVGGIDFAAILEDGTTAEAS
jgi:hypothetical protein